MVYEHLKEVGAAVAASASGPSRGPVYQYNQKGEKAAFADTKTLYELFEHSCDKFADEPLLGHRPKDADGKAGDYVWITYKETRDKAKGIAASLKAAGLQKGERVAVFGGNSPEWMLAMQACNRLGLHCVPLYDSLGENAIEYIIDHSESSFLFVSAAKLPDFAAALPKIQRTLKGVVVWGAASDAARTAVTDAGLSVTPFEEFLSAGASLPEAADPPAPTDYCTIMYTSGTTGDPKGVMLTHAAVLATINSLVEYLSITNSKLGPGDAMLSYLPLAHIFDRTSEEMFIAVGGRIGYWQGNITELVNDIGALRPTMFIGVPRVFDRIYNGVMDGVAKSGCVKSVLFKWAFSGKLNRLKAGFSSDEAAPFWDKLVFSKVKARLGGRVRLIVSGGAPLAPHVEDFLKVAMCAPVVQGYGLTETCAASFIAIPNDKTQTGTVGPPQPVTAFCLESVPEMNYDAVGTPARGELLLKGANNFSGYYKMQDKTDEVLEADGWFHTGDVAEIQPNGSIKIIDRKKNIFKLSQGEYIAVEKLEAEYKKCSIVNQIWVYGNSFESCVVAVVVPKQETLMAWAKGAGIEGTFADVCKDARARAHVLDALKAQAKDSKLKGFEVLKGVFLDPAEFSVERDTITPTFKLRRPQLQREYQAELDAMYAKLKTAA